MVPWKTFSSCRLQVWPSSYRERSARCWRGISAEVAARPELRPRDFRRHRAVLRGAPQLGILTEQRTSRRCCPRSLGLPTDSPRMSAVGLMRWLLRAGVPVLAEALPGPVFPILSPLEQPRAAQVMEGCHSVSPSLLPSPAHFWGRHRWSRGFSASSCPRAIWTLGPGPPDAPR